MHNTSMGMGMGMGMDMHEKAYSPRGDSIEQQHGPL